MARDPREPFKMAKMCMVSRLERQFATLYLFHAPTWPRGPCEASWCLAAKIDSPLSRGNFWLAITLTEIASQNASQIASPPQERAFFPLSKLGNEKSARSFSDRSFFVDVRAACPCQNACFSRAWRAWPKLWAGCPQGRPAENFLGWFFVSDKLPPPRWG